MWQKITMYSLGVKIGHPSRKSKTLGLSGNNFNPASQSKAILDIGAHQKQQFKLNLFIVSSLIDFLL
jgi:hypothetical protein